MNVRYEIETSNGTLSYETPDEIRSALEAGVLSASDIIHQDGGIQPTTVCEFLGSHLSNVTVNKGLDAPISFRSAGILTILAGLASLGISRDPGHPGGPALITMLLAFGGAASSFLGKRQPARTCTRTVVVITGLFGIILTLSVLVNGGFFDRPAAPELVPLQYLFYFLIRGGLACLLGVWALWNLGEKGWEAEASNSRHSQHAKIAAPPGKIPVIKIALVILLILGLGVWTLWKLGE